MRPAAAQPAVSMVLAYVTLDRRDGLETGAKRICRTAAIPLRAHMLQNIQSTAWGWAAVAPRYWGPMAAHLGRPSVTAILEHAPATEGRALSAFVSEFGDGGRNDRGERTV